MYVVSLVTMTAPAEAEAVPIASELGLTVYETRMKLAAAKPSILLQTADEAQATKLARRLQERGHGAIAFDTKAVIGSSEMTAVDHYRLTGNGVEIDPVPGQRQNAEEPLPYDDISALLLAMHRTSSEETKEEAHKEFSAGRALMSGGLVRNRTVSRSVTTHSEQREHVLYIYRRVGRPWIFRERARHVGPPVGVGRLETFRNIVTQLRANCPRALFDDRLMKAKPPERINARDMSAGLAASNEQGIDLLAYALASWITAAQGNPYRA